MNALYFIGIVAIAFCVSWVWMNHEERQKRREYNDRMRRHEYEKRMMRDDRDGL